MGATEVMLGRESGLQRMDLSTQGFTWSFAGLLLVVLIDTSGLSAIYNTMAAANDTISVSKTGFIMGKLIASGLAYLAAMLALYLLCREPQEQARFPIAVITHNWAAPVVSIAVLPLLFVSTFNPATSTADGAGSVWTLLTMGLTALLILVGVRLVRISLDVSLSKACLFFAVTTGVSLVCSDGVERLMGLQKLAE
ncbi:MAG: hypothetical protein ACR2PF_05750 [Rhizobiaceae bacterium]